MDKHLAFSLYQKNKKTQSDLAKVLKNDHSLPQSELTYLNLKKYTFGSEERDYKHFNTCCGKAFSSSEYDEYKVVFVSTIGPLIAPNKQEFLDYLDETKGVKTNDDYIKVGKITVLNALIYHMTIEPVFAQIVIDNESAFAKILALFEATYDFFDSHVKLMDEHIKLIKGADEFNKAIESQKDDLSKEKNNLKKSQGEVESLKKKLEKADEKIAKTEEEVEKLKAFNKSQEEIIESYKETEKERDEYKNHYFELKEKYDNLLENQRTVLNAMPNTTIEESDANSIVEEAEVIVPNNFNENKFLDYFLKVLEKKGLCYDKEDIYNFHVSCKSSNLTILAGASGMGKTRLPLAYAECINVRESDGTLLFLPISPSYTEPSDVLGFYNSQKEEYVPSETGLVDFIKHAQDNPTKMHMVIFDEMNLSQIEYWFAPFMSILEKPKGERIITLYSKSKENKNSPYPPTITIGDNILFIGTINLDETTKDMSDRLMDRAIVINLKKQTFKDYMDQQPLDDIEEYKCINSQDYNSMRPNFEDKYIASLSKDEVKFFDDLHDTLQKANNGKCVSHRNVKKIAYYLESIKQIDGFPRKVAFDYIFKQTILKKINGYDESIKQILGDLDDNDQIINSSLFNLLKDSKKISDFKYTREDIVSKIKEYKNYGFTR